MFVLVTGGSGSGKSEYAERVLVAQTAKDMRYYIATMMPYGEEGRKRVEKHRRQRAGRGFHTIERYLDLAGLDMQKFHMEERKGMESGILLECMSNLVANEIFDEQGSHERAEKSISEGIRRLKSCTDHLVVVTNEVFSDGITYDPETMDYLKCLGRINQELASMADIVVEVVCGIPLSMKGELPCVF
jgi:adenosylcobinamide kinase/adenosylcobinamide-phosphate guanylyltransferase